MAIFLIFWGILGVVMTLISYIFEKKISEITVIEHILLCYFLLFHGLAQHYTGLGHFSFQFLVKN